MDWPSTRLSGSRQVAPPAVILELYREVNSPPTLYHLSELPQKKPAAAAIARKKEWEASWLSNTRTRKEKIPCTKCESKVQRDGMKRHERSMHWGIRRRVHVCPFEAGKKTRMYSTYHNWKNHVVTTHAACLEVWEYDSLLQEGYVARFMLDHWYRFHEITGSESDSAYQRVAWLRHVY